MGLIQFDFSGAVDADYGVTEAQIADLAPKLLDLQQEFVDVAPPFASLPRELLDGYTELRDDSPLGQIFRVANRLHDEVDAVVVLAGGGAYRGVQSLRDACCDPYHNELSRGGRGSKPRMYFTGNDLDNDASSALLHRLGRDLTAIDPVVRRWAMVVIDPAGETRERALALRQFLPAMEESLADDVAQWLPELLLPVTDQPSKLRDLAQAIGCKEIFPIPAAIDERFNVLSAAGVLPAAMLGLDCVQLLEGAAAMDEHFKTAPPETNLVLQYVAIHHLLQTQRGLDRRVMNVWGSALETFGLWHDQLLAGSGNQMLPLTTVSPRDGHHLDPANLQGKVVNHLIVQQHRADPWQVGHNDGDHDGLNALSDRKLPDLMTEAIADTDAALHAAGCPTTQLRMREIDTHTLGQLFQMLMLATTVESQLQRDGST
ncbi:Glucose-6-phosphate isomerase [Rosistilla oblonga]|uniref:glucose-6-phosphate isomerase n=1 Tax=Rosistilla oblonga TaxID=2527990 RepID=UPI001188EBAF|nr:glucose-6-phosphate isomerase [Rosistilla oblonga]QDV10239.1 Glucose-6-phosphate isomerase [Rosistilla oblonga]